MDNLHIGSGGAKNTVISQAIADNLEVFAITGHVEYIRTDDKCVYPACPECKKKLTEDMSSGWECNSCDKTFEKPVYTYMLSFKFSDPTGTLWMNCFRESGEVLLNGMTAEKYNSFMTSEFTSRPEGPGSVNSIDELKQIGISNSFNQFKVFVKHTEDTYNGEMRDRYTALKIYKLSNLNQDNMSMLSILNAFKLKDVNAGISKMKIAN